MRGTMVFFFFKQKTAYELRISDWSSDVCSSDLIAARGYRPYLSGGEAREQARRTERNRWLLRLGIAGLGTMQAMMFAEALYFDFNNEMPLATRDFFRWITLLVSSPVVFYSGWPFIAGMARELRGRRPVGRASWWGRECQSV